MKRSSVEYKTIPSCGVKYLLISAHNLTSITSGLSVEMCLVSEDRFCRSSHAHVHREGEILQHIQDVNMLLHQNIHVKIVVGHTGIRKKGRDKILLTIIT